MSQPSPNAIDSLLYETETLKTVIIDNHAMNGEAKPLKEFREVMQEHGRRFLKAYNKALGFYVPTDEQIQHFEKQYYGDNGEIKKEDHGKP
jgi:hypothetical protein